MLSAAGILASLWILTPGSIASPAAAGAERQLAAMRSSTYAHKTFVDEAKGVYNYDCSGFVGEILKRVDAEALKEVRHPGHKRPLAADFVYRFATLPAEGRGRWMPVRRAQDLEPGDFVAWLRPPKNKGTDTGHVMVVRQAPTVNPDRIDEVLVVVIDSTSSFHAADSRKNGANGLGSGTIGLIVDLDGKPVAYRWRGGVSKEDSVTQIRMARLRRAGATGFGYSRSRMLARTETVALGD